MPNVELDLDIRAPVERVWLAVTDIERYSRTMENVRSARVLEVISTTARRCAWSVTLKGSILEWEEIEHLDHDRHIVEFNQLSGDMEVFAGRWTLEERSPALTNVRFSVDFEIGIPLLAEMLNPVAQRSLRDNCSEMLLGIERESLSDVTARFG
jgi:ribosome-associated toxin RatA of RatAB toxin-antitoxin module